MFIGKLIFSNFRISTFNRIGPTHKSLSRTFLQEEYFVRFYSISKSVLII